MADKNEYYEFLYAYAFGCLDEDDLKSLKNYLASNEDYFWQELGEFQNLSALLPSILNIEKPEPEVKDKVARKLYRIRNEIKAKRDKNKNAKSGVEPVVEKKEVESPENVEEVKEKDIEKQEEEISEEKTKPDVEEFEVVSSEKKPDGTAVVEEKKEAMPKEENLENIEGEVLNFNKPEETVNSDEIDTKTDESEAPGVKAKRDSNAGISMGDIKKPKQRRSVDYQVKSNKKSNTPFIIVSVLMFLLAAVFVFLYFKVSSNVKSYESQIVSLNAEIMNLKEQFRQNKDLQTVLGSRNLKTVTLAGSNIATDASAKLFISLDTNHGILQLSNIPPLRGNGTYQLWIYIYDNYLSLGKFIPTETAAFFSFDTPQLSESSTVSFLVTEEPAGGSFQPGDKVYLARPSYLLLKDKRYLVE